MHSCASNKENQNQIEFFQGVTGSLWFSPPGGNQTVKSYILSGVAAVGKKSSHAYKRFQKKLVYKKVCFLKILLTCNALFASFISSIFSFDLKNKIMLVQTSTWSVMLSQPKKLV